MAVLATRMSTLAVTVLVTDLLLLLRSGSPTSSEVTDAVLMRLPVVAMLGRTTTVTVAVAPEVMSPNSHTRFAEPTLRGAVGVQEPCEATIDCKPPVYTKLLNLSVTRTLVEVAGPLLRTVIT